MKRLIVLIGILALILPIFGGWQAKVDFVATGFALAAAETKVIGGTGFTDNSVRVIDISSALLTMTFTRAAGSATLTVDYYFQVSYDGGTTWADFHDPIADADYLSVIAGHSVISGTTVRVSRIIPLNGVSHIRFSKVINNDTSNALTAVNATLSW